MASKSFALNTEPHEATVGDLVFYFEPFVTGAEFAEAYADLTAVQAKLKAAKGAKATSGKPAKADNTMDPKLLAEVSDAMRTFILQFMVTGDQLTAFANLKVPDGLLVDVINWLAELYGGSSGNDPEPGGTSSD